MDQIYPLSRADVFNQRQSGVTVCRQRAPTSGLIWLSFHEASDSPRAGRRSSVLVQDWRPYCLKSLEAVT